MIKLIRQASDSDVVELKAMAEAYEMSLDGKYATRNEHVQRNEAKRENKIKFCSQQTEMNVFRIVKSEA